MQKHFVVHPDVATAPALAACAAGKQGKYQPFVEELWNRAWPTEGGGPRFDGGKFAQPELEKLATEQKLDLNKFKTDMAGPECKALLAGNQREMAGFGVNGTPTIFVNGKIYQGPRTVEGFAAVIDPEIKKADDALKAGAKIDTYYDAVVIKDGKKTI